MNIFKKEKAPTVTILLGMHRSGTSLLAGSLQNYGLNLGNIAKGLSANLLELRENKEIWLLNEEVLQYNAAAWDEPTNKIEWNDVHRKKRDVVIRRLSRNYKYSFGFKDPRTLLLLAFWLEGLSGFRKQFVASFRHPLSVAKSLHNRNGMQLNHALELWEHYNRILANLISERKMPLVNFDVDERTYLKTIALVAFQLKLPGAGLPGHKAFFKTQLIHQQIDESTQLPENIENLYNDLLALYSKQRFSIISIAGIKFWRLKSRISRTINPMRKRSLMAKHETDKQLIMASGLFDETFYLENNPDVAASSWQPLDHFLLYGGFEGRRPNQSFNIQKILDENPELPESDTNPLVHYLNSRKQGE
jgi:hypothetical protein